MADEQTQFGQAGVEANQGFYQMPEAPPAKSEEVEAVEALEKWSQNREAEVAAKPIIDRSYQHIDGDNAGKPYDPHASVPLDRAAKDLAATRDTEAMIAEIERDLELANQIDEARREGLGQSVRAQQPEAQQTDQQPVAQPEQQPQTHNNDGLDGIDPEVAAAFRNPKILNVLTNHYGAAEVQVNEAVSRAEAQVSAAVQQTAEWSRQSAELAAAAILAAPELQGVHPSQIPGALQALATANPQAAQRIQQQLNTAQTLVQRSQEAQRVQQQRSAIQFQQAAAAHDAAFDQTLAHETPETRTAIKQGALQILRDSGLSDADIAHHWNSSPLLRSVTGQQVLADAARWRAMKSGIKAAPARVPHVVRPGSSVDRPDAAGRADFAIENKYSGNLNARQAAELVISRRARSR